VIARLKRNSRVYEKDVSETIGVFADSAASIDTGFINIKIWALQRNKMLFSGVGLSLGRFGAGLGGDDGLLPLNHGFPCCSVKGISSDPKSGRHNDESARFPRYPPVWIRVPTALVLGIGSNGIMLLGIWSFDSGRRRRGIILCGSAVAMFISGIGLMLLLAFPVTWGWWV
jgi:hypothetical protein